MKLKCNSCSCIMEVAMSQRSHGGELNLMWCRNCGSIQRVTVFPGEIIAGKQESPKRNMPVETFDCRFCGALNGGKNDT